MADRQLAAGVYDNPDSPPPPDAKTAPYGYVWRRNAGWQVARRRPKPGTRRAGLPAGTEPGTPADSERPASPTSGPDGPGREDPAPGWQAASQPGGEGPGPDNPRLGPGHGKVNYGDVPQQVKDDIAGLAGLVATPILSLLQSLDPYCGTVLAQNLEPVVDAALPLICRSQRIVDYFARDQADWLLWGKLAMALKPVAQAIAEHHIFRTVDVVRDPGTGAVTIERRERGGPAERDHLTPHPQPAYAA